MHFAKSEENKFLCFFTNTSGRGREGEVQPTSQCFTNQVFVEVNEVTQTQQALLENHHEIIRFILLKENLSSRSYKTLPTLLLH